MLDIDEAVGACTAEVRRTAGARGRLELALADTPKRLARSSMVTPGWSAIHGSEGEDPAQPGPDDRPRAHGCARFGSRSLTSRHPLEPGNELGAQLRRIEHLGIVEQSEQRTTGTRPSSSPGARPRHCRRVVARPRRVRQVGSTIADARVASTSTLRLLSRRRRHRTARGRRSTGPPGGLGGRLERARPARSRHRLRSDRRGRRDLVPVVVVADDVPAAPSEQRSPRVEACASRRGTRTDTVA